MPDAQSPGEPMKTHHRWLVAVALAVTSCDAGPRPTSDGHAPPPIGPESPHEHALVPPRRAPAWLDFLSAPAAHEDQEARPAFQRANATLALARILEDNASFVREHDAAHFAPFEESQHPRVTVVACADSRFHDSALESDPDGDLFVVRNIGNQIDSAEGSVEYGVRHLHTPLLLVIGHVGCGAVKAALGDYGEEPHTIRHELDGLHLSLRNVMGEKGTFDARWHHGVLENVHRQVAGAARDYDDLVRSGDLLVVGAVYDFRDQMNGGRGRLHVIDINGERDLTRPAAAELLDDVRRAAHVPSL